MASSGCGRCSLLVLLWPALDHRLNRYDGRWYALATLWVALDHLFTDAMAQRTAADPAFFGTWAFDDVGRDCSGRGAGRGALASPSGNRPGSAYALVSVVSCRRDGALWRHR